MSIDDQKTILSELCEFRGRLIIEYEDPEFNHNYAAAPNTASTAPAAASKTVSLDDATNAVIQRNRGP